MQRSRDWHIETYRAYGLVGKVRAVVIETATGRQLYVTWPYASEAAAVERAEGWVRQEGARRRQMAAERGLFAL